jgi:hypothetical protein
VAQRSRVLLNGRTLSSRSAGLKPLQSDDHAQRFEAQSGTYQFTIPDGTSNTSATTANRR